MSYEHLSDEDKIITAIGFVARGVTIPHQLRDFLEGAGLFDLITKPEEVQDDRHSEGHSG